MKKYKINISEEPHCQELESLGSIFIPLLKNVLSTEDMVGVDIILKWRDIVGENIAAFCNPLKTKYNSKENIRTLFVEVPVGGFALEIQHKENYILEKINSYFGYQAFHKLNISQNANMKLNVFNRNGLDNQKEIKISKVDEEFLKGISSEIKDEKLREILIKIGKNVITSQGSN